MRLTEMNGMMFSMRDWLWLQVLARLSQAYRQKRW